MTYVPKFIRVYLAPDVMRALGQGAEDEKREPREQAAVMIEEGLRMRGFLGGSPVRVIVAGDLEQLDIMARSEDDRDQQSAVSSEESSV